MWVLCVHVGVQGRRDPKGEVQRVEDHEEVGEIPGAVRQGLKNKVHSITAYLTIDVPLTARV